MLFIAFADVHALIRYARVLQYIAQGFPTLRQQPLLLLLSVAWQQRHAISLWSCLHQRLQILAAAAPSRWCKADQQRVCETLTTGLTPEPLQHFPAFVDAYIYFHAIVDTLRAHLDTPATERPSVQSEEHQTPRPARRKRRQNKDRWREGEPERR